MIALVRPLEWLIAINALLGLLLAFYAVGDYAADMRAIPAGTNGYRRMTAAVGLRTALALAFVFALLFLSGVVALVGPLPTPGRVERAVDSLAILEAIVFVLSVLKALNIRDRAKLMR